MTAIIIEPILEKLNAIDKKLDMLLTVSPAFKKIGDTYTFFDDGKSIKEMIKEDPSLDIQEWVLHLPCLEETESPCKRTITIAQEGSETTGKTFIEQEHRAEQKERSICTLRQMLALSLAAKNAEKVLSSCWMRVVDQDKSGDRLIVIFGAHGISVNDCWNDNANSSIGLATSPSF